jgi:polar amino acid transport system permease protein
MNWSWTFAWHILPALLRGLVVTVEATVLGTALAALFGLALALLRRSIVKPVAMTAGAFVEFVRSTPLLVQLYFLFYVLPLYGIVFSALATGIIALGTHYATYMSEVYRAGIESVPRGQWEAAKALNLPRWSLWRSVILPQAIPAVLPALGNYLIAMFKDTPVLSTITVVELLLRAKTIGDLTFRYLEPLTLVGVLFFVLSYPSSHLVRRLEARFAHPR